jgi:FixJ family two-component response regulator
LPDSPLISIVEDDVFVREATGRLVRSLGFSAAAFVSAEDFLRSDCVSQTSCLITDVHMPGLSGLELQGQLIARGRRTPVIFITAFPDDKVRMQALRAGAVAFLSKPFEEESLINCINTALASHQGPDVEK